MELKDYQQQALETLDRYLEALKEAHLQLDKVAKILSSDEVPDSLRNYPLQAWESLRKKSGLPGVPDKNGENHIPEYISREAASGEPIPHVCLKVPTGGGKTLLGVEAVRRLKIGTGFLLWIVPTKAIYTQTLNAFSDRDHPYRQILDHASGDRVKLLEKDNKFTKQDVENHLCVMLLMLPSANREKNKEFLKIFRDSSGYDSFFPIEDDIRKHQALSEEHPDLETAKPDEPGQIRGMLAANPADRLIKQSLFNVLKLLRPTVILDEAHKAYGSKKAENNREFVAAVNRLNPRFVLELSATPQLGISNILVNIPGTALKDEEMIKIPIQLRNFPNSDWKWTLAKAKTERDKLEEATKQFQHVENRYIRPIAVIRVDRTGKKQRDGIKVHAQDARDELIKVLGVPEEHIKVKSSEQDELAGVDLLSPFCPVRYIITKDALKEGWDCPFAYQLALLDNTTAQTAMTQLIGRVMRQPHARATNLPELDTCYIYCFNQKVGDAVDNVKKGLEAEGLTGLAEYVESTDADREKKSIQRRKKYRKVDIFLPQVLHKRGRSWEMLNYERDILSVIDWSQLGAVEPVNLDDKELLQEIRAAIHLQDHDDPEKVFLESAAEKLEVSFFVRRLNDVIPNPWQAARIVKATLEAYWEQGTDEDKLYANRLYISEVLKNKLRAHIETLTQTVFQQKLDNNKIRFSLETDVELNFELEKMIEVNISKDAKRLTRSDASPVQLNLFNPVYEAEFNNLEKDFALYLDKKDAIQWWHRIAARQGYFLQGWRRDRVYPDFIACVQGDKKGQQRLLIFETKGQHLEGNSDTTYKQELIKTLEAAYKNATEYGTMETTGPNDKPMSFRMLLEDTWRETVNEAIDDNYASSS